MFGVNSSPFQAQFVLQHHAKKFKDTFPLVAETVLRSTYMDDSMDSVVNEDQGIELHRQLSQLLTQAGMHARKWLSNLPRVLRDIPLLDRRAEVDLEFPLAFDAGWLQGHWWGFIRRNYVVWPTFLLMNVFIALKGSHFWFLFDFTAAGVVPCGGRKTSPRTWAIV